MFQSVNPATGEIVRRYDPHDADQVELRLSRAHAVFQSWRRTAFEDRAKLLRGIAGALEADREDLARLMTLEMGKPIAAAEAEVDKCAWVCRHYAEYGAGYLAPEPVETEARESYVRFDPLGPLLAVMPWNFPLWQVFRHAAPALMAGNVVVLKHAENVTGCALAIEDLFAHAGAEEGLLQVLLTGHATVGMLLEDMRVCGVALTGSVAAGRTVASHAGRGLKKTVLELGGSDPFIVLADANLARAATEGASARLLNNGQSCIAAKRFIVDEAVATEFTDRLTAAVESRVVGDPMDRAVDVGPMARQDLRVDLHEQVARSRRAGARVVAGGRPLPGPGFFYEPTVVVDVTPDVAVGAEETFGPVAAIVRVDGAEQAIAVANDSCYGLGASVWTGDRGRAADLASRLDAGCVFVNEVVKSDPRVPFGGVKDSGFGRELGSYGIREFVNVKTVWIQ